MPTLQRRNEGLVNILRADFQHRYEPNFAWVNSVSSGLLLPALRAFWPVSSVDEAPAVYDQSGQGRVLSPGQAGPTYGIYNLLPYADFVRASSQYLYRTDEPGLSSAGGMTIGGWFYFDAPAMGNVVALMAKWDTAPGDQREYRLWKDAADLPNFSVSKNGTAAGTTTVTGATALVVSNWYFMVGRLVADTSVDLFVNDVAANRATLTEYNAATTAEYPFDSTSDLTIGADENGTSNFHDGRATLMHLSGVAVKTYPVAPDVIIFSLFEQQRAGFNC